MWCLSFTLKYKKINTWSKAGKMLIVKSKQCTCGCLLYYSFCMFENFNRKVTQSMLWALVGNWLQQTSMVLLLQSDPGAGNCWQETHSSGGLVLPPRALQGASQQLGRLRPASTRLPKSKGRPAAAPRQAALSQLSCCSKRPLVPGQAQIGSNSDTVSLVSSSADLWLLDLEGEKIP